MLSVPSRLPRSVSIKVISKLHIAFAVCLLGQAFATDVEMVFPEAVKALFLEHEWGGGFFGSPKGSTKWQKLNGKCSAAGCHKYPWNNRFSHCRLLGEAVCRDCIIVKDVVFVDKNAAQSTHWWQRNGNPTTRRSEKFCPSCYKVLKEFCEAHSENILKHEDEHFDSMKNKVEEYQRSPPHEIKDNFMVNSDHVDRNIPTKMGVAGRRTNRRVRRRLPALRSPLLKRFSKESKRRAEAI